MQIGKTGDSGRKPVVRLVPPASDVALRQRVAKSQRGWHQALVLAGFEVVGLTGWYDMT
ncbi:MAG TPA: hypothetical protein VGI75_10020 [Pirellulales bacterium]|jgi:hypothetical protein